MDHTVHFMAITTERQLLPAKAARGWAAEQAQVDGGIVRSILDHATQIVNRIQAIRTAAACLPGQSDRQGRSPAKRLMDMLPTE